MTGGYNVTNIAVLCENHNLPWKSVKPLYENSIEFNYLEKKLLISDLCIINEGNINIQKQKYNVIIIEDACIVTIDVISSLTKFSDGGGTIIINNENEDNDKLRSVIDFKETIELLNLPEILDSRDLYTEHNQKSLRVSHLIKDGLHFYIIVNEGEEEINDIINIKNVGNVEKWDAWNGEIDQQEVLEINDEFIEVQLELNRRESVIFVVDSLRPVMLTNNKKKYKNYSTIEINSPWKIYDEENNLIHKGKLTLFNELKGRENYSGTIAYENEFTIENIELISELQLELEEAYEIVKVFINKKQVGLKMWAPYIYDFSEYVRSGLNTLRIEATNSLANKICKVSLKSGIEGNVMLRVYK